MTYIPESLHDTNMPLLDEIFGDNIAKLPAADVLIDFARENDPVKLTMWMEQFGVPRELLPDDMSEFRLLELLKRTIRIYRLGGTAEGIKTLAEALGAEQVSVHTGAYGSSTQPNSFSVSLIIYTYNHETYYAFRSTLETLFPLFCPVSLWLNDVKIKNTIFNNNFNSKFI